jgi:transcriptional regulator with XRE-family HTH domain
MDRLSAHANAGREDGDRDFPGSEVLPKPHDDMLTDLVNTVNQIPSPPWPWRESPIRRLLAMGNRIRELRLQRNLTLEEVADGAGTSVQQISRLELGDRRLTDDWMRRIAPALGVQPADLLARSGPDDREVVQNLEERKLLLFWRGLDIDDRLIIAAIARTKGLEILNNKPKKRSA